MNRRQPSRRILLCVQIAVICAIISFGTFGLLIKNIPIGYYASQCRKANVTFSTSSYRPNFVQQGFGVHQLPRIIHWTYRHYFLPQQTEQMVKTCLNLNPEFQFLFWTDIVAVQFIAKQLEKHESPEVKEKQLQIIESYYGIEKSDILRLFLVYYLGGIYLDLDVECKVPFTRIFQEPSLIQSAFNQSLPCLFDQEIPIQTMILHNMKMSLMNSFFACAPRHPFIRFLINNLTLNENKQGNILLKTGPHMITRLYLEYQKLSSNPIVVANPLWFSPALDEISHLIQLCLKEKMKSIEQQAELRLLGCKLMQTHSQEYFSNSHSYKAFLVHRFLHFGYYYDYDLNAKRFNICLKPNVYEVSISNML